MRHAWRHGLSTPSDFERYRRLVHHVFDPAKRQLAEEAAREPALKAAYARWRQGDDARNLALFYPTFDRLSALMGLIYGFRPARLGQCPDMHGNYGAYDYRGAVHVAERILDLPIADVVDTIVHEQLHCLQHHMTEGLGAHGRRRMTADEVRLARYWLEEEPRAQAFYARANSGRPLSPDEHLAYRQLGKEYHAYDTAEYVARRLAGAFRRRAR